MEKTTILYKIRGIKILNQRINDKWMMNEKEFKINNICTEKKT